MTFKLAAASNGRKRSSFINMAGERLRAKAQAFCGQKQWLRGLMTLFSVLGPGNGSAVLSQKEKWTETQTSRTY